MSNENTIKAIETSYYQIALNEVNGGYIVRHSVLGTDHATMLIRDYKTASFIFDNYLKELEGA